MLQQLDLQFSANNLIDNHYKTALIPENTYVWTRVNIAGSGTIEQKGVLHNYFIIKFKIIDGIYQNHVLRHTYYLPRPLSIYPNLDAILPTKNALICAVIESIIEAIRLDGSLTLTQILQSTDLQHYNNIICMTKIGIYDNSLGTLFNRNIIIEIF